MVRAIASGASLTSMRAVLKEEIIIPAIILLFSIILLLLYDWS